MCVDMCHFVGVCVCVCVCACARVCAPGITFQAFVLNDGVALLYLHVRLHWIKLLLLHSASLVGFYFAGGQSDLGLAIGEWVGVLCATYMLCLVWYFVFHKHHPTVAPLRWSLFALTVALAAACLGLGTHDEALAGLLHLAVAALTFVCTLCLPGHFRLTSLRDFDRLYALLTTHNNNFTTMYSSQVVSKVKVVPKPLPALTVLLPTVRAHPTHMRGIVQV